MRTPVYRNLDRPFQILGLYPMELVVLTVLFAAGSEAAEFLGVARIWLLLLVGLAVAAILALRRTLGPFFSARLMRFLLLPSHLHPRLFLRPEREAAV